MTGNFNSNQIMTSTFLTITNSTDPVRFGPCRIGNNETNMQYDHFRSNREWNKATGSWWGVGGFPAPCVGTREVSQKAKYHHRDWDLARWYGKSTDQENKPQGHLSNTSRSTCCSVLTQAGNGASSHSLNRGRSGREETAGKRIWCICFLAAMGNGGREVAREWRHFKR